MRRRTVAAVAGAVVLAVGAGAGISSAAGRDTLAVREQVLAVPGTPEDGQPVTLDTSLFLPDTSTPEPAVLLAHGFGASKADLAPQARALASHGYVVLTYTARGFGASGGLIHLDSPDYEVADARRMVDLLATRHEVLQDGRGDPRVGVAGGSYGGALTLLLAATDRRVDAIAPQITWADLRQALFPQFSIDPSAPASPAAIIPTGGPGVFKRAWSGVFFGPGGSGGATTAVSATPPAPGPAGRGIGSAACGRFAPVVCREYQRVAASGRPDAGILNLLWQSSPGRLDRQITAPTLLIQGEADSLFPLSEGDINALAISSAGTPVKVVWEGGGHDGGLDESARLQTLTLTWFDRYLKHDGSPRDTRWEVTVPNATISSTDTDPAPQIRVAPSFPTAAAGPVRTTSLTLTGDPQFPVAPAGAYPAALTSLPGLGTALGLGGQAGATSALSALPGQVAVFQTAPLPAALTILGGPRVSLTVAGTSTNASLFAQLYDVSPSGSATLPEQLVSPIHLTGLTRTPRQIVVGLPAVVHDVPAGHRLRLVISTTDQSFAMPPDPRQYRIGLADGGTLVVPTPTTAQLVAGGVTPLLPWIAGVALLVLAALAAATLASRRVRRSPVDPELEGVPLAITDLGKAYGDGFRAVADLTFRVEQGWVLGLLGPNGAGKTTTLRMVMGLIRPTEGNVRVFGHAISAGAPVLSRVGSLLEGPGFLPHISGSDNLRLFWQATGRPRADAHEAAALEVAGLGEDIHRKVRTYSQGMRQRLAIAQAMLGLPDLLLLDEPTNGLDPPQIREMREVLARYAATGRTVVISSHLLAEVEQTCSHVVVMHQGRLAFSGTVTELVGSSTALLVDVDDPVRAAQIAAGVPGVHDVRTSQTGLVLALVATQRGALVRALVDAGLSVERVAPQRGLEEAFLTLVGES